MGAIRGRCATIVGLGMLTVPVTPGQTAALAPQLSVQIDNVISEFMSGHKVPGVSIAVANSETILYERGYGLADLENLVPADAFTVYRIASVTKPITATAVLQLVEQEKIDLSAPISRYVQGLNPEYERVTVRDLLRHTGGVRHYKEIDGSDRAEFTSTSMRHCDSLAESLGLFAGDPLDHEPGVKLTYSSYGYVLLGLAVESASGISFSDYLARNVFAPADMNQTYVDDPQSIVPDRSEGYVRNQSGLLRNAARGDNTCKLPAGGLLSTVGDLSRFMIALEGGKLLSARSIAEMTSNRLPEAVLEQATSERNRYPGWGYGYGWITATEMYPDSVWHGGVGLGVTTAIYMLPQEDLSLVILTNLQGKGTAIAKLADELATVVLETPH